MAILENSVEAPEEKKIKSRPTIEFTVLHTGFISKGMEPLCWRDNWILVCILGVCTIAK